MSFLFLIPSLIMLGIFYGAGIGYFFIALLISIFMASIPGSIGVIVAGLISKRIPGPRLKGVLTAAGSFLGLGIWAIINFADKIVAKDGMTGSIMTSKYQGIIDSPIFKWLPSGLAYNATANAARNDWVQAVLYIFIMASVSLFLGYLSIQFTKKYFEGGVLENVPSASGAGRFSLGISGSPLLAHVRRDILLFVRESGVYLGGLIIGIMMIVFPLIASGDASGKFFAMEFPPFMAIFGVVFGGQIAKGLLPLEKLGFWWNMVTPDGQRLAVVSKFILGITIISLGSAIIGISHILFRVASDIAYIMILCSFGIAGLSLGLPLGLFFGDFKWDNPKRMLKATGNFLFVIASMILASLMFAMDVFIMKRSDGLITVAAVSMAVAALLLIISIAITSIKFQNIEWL
jgi:hypothetical protein